MPTIVAFLLARIAEDERRLDNQYLAPHTPECDYPGDLPGYCNCSQPDRALADCVAKRAILEWHCSWPILVTEPPVFDTVPNDVTSYRVRATQRSTWLTTQEYVARFGVDPPTGPVLALLAGVYSDHPDYNPAWKVVS